VTLAGRLRSEIEASGPMPFEAFMAACLYDPDAGFFTTGPLRSARSGDFLTSPEVSPWFGRCLARFVAAEQDRLGDPTGFLVADIGAGSGSLLAGLRDAGGLDVELWAAEASPAAREALGGVVGGANVVEQVTELPAGRPAVIFANELLDNVPVSLAVRTGEGWMELWVGVAADDTLALTPVSARPNVAGWADSFCGTVPEGGMVEVQLAAGEWLRRALEHIASGAVVVIDYGGTAEELEPRRTRGTLRTYRNHHLGPDPLVAPGETDVTVDVNFTALLAAADGAGAVAELHRQDDFLTELGLGEEVSRLRHLELELARSGDAMARLQIRSEKTDAETLLHPRGLGDFRVLVARK
jgi:SAM-dependent MidA family methyltransferase